MKGTEGLLEGLKGLEGLKELEGLKGLEGLNSSSSSSEPLLAIFIFIALAIGIPLIYILFLKKYWGGTSSRHKELKKGVDYGMELSWKMRIGIAISVLWLLALLAFALKEFSRNVMGIFLSFGIIPIVTFWGIAWIIQGVKIEKRSKLLVEQQRQQKKQKQQQQPKKDSSG